MKNKVKDVQEYLEKRGIIVSETSIINTAIDMTERLGVGRYTFVCEFDARRGGRNERH